MERIKDALDKARAERQRHAETGSHLGKDRVLARPPFTEFAPELKSHILKTGRVVNLGAGATLHFAGDYHPCIHYLLSGSVSIEFDGEQNTVTAGSAAAQEPLDVNGIKASTVSAVTDVELLRVPSPAGDDIELEEDAPLPAAAYTETFSGQQLAALVEQINDEHQQFERQITRPAVVDPADLLAEIPPSGEANLAQSAADLLDELNVETPASDTLGTNSPPSAYEPEIDDALGRFTRDLEVQFRRYVEQVKAAERARYESQLQQHAVKLQGLAEASVRDQLQKLREHYEHAYEEKSQRLSDRYRNLRGFANKIARQKAAIYVARRQIAEKLQLVERIHVELAQLDSQLGTQLDDIDELPTDALQKNARNR